MKKRHSEEQIIRILRGAERGETSMREVCRQHNITKQTLYRWRNKYGGMDVPDARWRRFYNERRPPRTHILTGYKKPPQVTWTRANRVSDS